MSLASQARLIDMLCKMSDRWLRRAVSAELKIEALRVWCDEQDILSKGPSMTTTAVRRVIDKEYLPQ